MLLFTVRGNCAEDSGSSCKAWKGVYTMDLKRTQLYDAHVASGATMVDFGGWEMPIQYPTGIVAEHLWTRHECSLFDVSHMGRLLIEGPERVAFLQHVLSSNVMALDINMAQYCIIPDPDGGAVDDAYLDRYSEDRFLLVVNAANTDKDWAHLEKEIKGELEQTDNVEAAAYVGTVIAKRALEKGIKEVVFDRGGFIYQGKVAALAEAAREAGLEF